MARGLYEIKLKERFIPALSEDDAIEMYRNGDSALTEEEVIITPLVEEEHTMKLFILAKTMMSTEKFNSEEIAAAIRALATEFGYFLEDAHIADCILTWTERFDDMSLSELEEWIIG